MEVACDEHFETERTLTLCFRAKKITGGSLRAAPRGVWENVGRSAGCDLVSVVESMPSHQAPLSTGLASKAAAKRCSAGRTSSKTKGLTGYLFSEASLFVSDTTVTLKAFGQAKPLSTLEPILDVAHPGWQQKHPEQYLKFASFTRLRRVHLNQGWEDQSEPQQQQHAWAMDVNYLQSFFAGEALVLGSQPKATHHVYVANYLAKDDVFDVFSTRIALRSLDPTETMVHFSRRGKEHATTLEGVWSQLHGDEPRSIAAHPHFDECFFEPVGYSANAVFSHHFTTLHVTPQPSSLVISVETSVPMTAKTRQRFVIGAEGMCRASELWMTDFALCPALFVGALPPQILGFEIQQSSQTVGKHFACALHHYKRVDLLSASHIYSSEPSAPLAEPVALAAKDLSVAFAPPARTFTQAAKDLEVPLLKFNDALQAPVKAAEFFLGCSVLKVAKDAPVALLDIGVLKRHVEKWRQLLPRVEPYYAVKCNPHPVLVKTLWDAWQDHGVGGFDCASPTEVDFAISLGVDPRDRIIYAPPCKQNTAISFARSAGVKTIVFDNAAELVKLKELYPNAELVLRVQTDDTLAQCPLSSKLGAALEDCGELLSRAEELCLNVVGVSFHVGSGCSQLGAFCSALRRARTVFDEAERRGLELTLLDIGGGFPGWDVPDQASFEDHAIDIETVLAELFPSSSIKVIAEPGRFFAATAQASLTTVVSVADVGHQGYRYYLNDGVYGSFNTLIYDRATVPRPTVLRSGRELREEDAGPMQPCTIFGPTCDGFDVITDSMSLPRLHVGDHLLFPNMGAYTSAASTYFNCLAPCQVFVYESLK